MAAIPVSQVYILDLPCSVPSSQFGSRSRRFSLRKQVQRLRHPAQGCPPRSASAVWAASLPSRPCEALEMMPWAEGLAASLALCATSPAPTPIFPRWPSWPWQCLISTKLCVLWKRWGGSEGGAKGGQGGPASPSKIEGPAVASAASPRFTLWLFLA